jgi:hypothetical protein
MTLRLRRVCLLLLFSLSHATKESKPHPSSIAASSCTTQQCNNNANATSFAQHHPTSPHTQQARQQASSSMSTKQTQQSPHIVVVVLDDVGWGGLKGYNGGVSGTQYPHTPNMDRSIREGIKLTNLYVQAMCSPTRSALMTGRFPHRFGGQHFVQQPFQPTWMPEDETTLADKMKALGYKTSIVGKWVSVVVCCVLCVVCCVLCVVCCVLCVVPVLIALWPRRQGTNNAVSILVFYFYYFKHSILVTG